MTKQIISIIRRPLSIAAGNYSFYLLTLLLWLSSHKKEKWKLKITFGLKSSFQYVLL